MVWYIPIMLILIGAFVLGCLQAASNIRAQGHAPDDAGWLYFIGGKGTPIKIGLSKHDPAGERIADLKTMSPFPLRVIYKLEVQDRYAAERMAHEHLAPFRQHGEWFDRDATLAFISHLKGEY